MTIESKNPETIALHAGWRSDPTTNSVAVPIHQTTSYQFDSTEHASNLFALSELGNIYSRIMNPTCDVLEQRVAALEGGAAALAVASGQTATAYALQNLAKAGDNIVSSTDLYGGTWNQLNNTFKDMGIEVRFVDPKDPSAFEEATDDKTRAYFAETLPNPKLEVFPIKEVSDIGRKFGIPLIVDNTAAPILCKPFEHGAAVIVYSTTKYIGGHGTSIGGLIVDGGNFDWAGAGDRQPALNNPDPSYHGAVFTVAAAPLGPIAYILKARTTILRDLGGAMSPMNAFQFIQGLETLPLRIREHSRNAQSVSEFLEKHEKVSKVIYPGLQSGDWILIFGAFDIPAENKSRAVESLIQGTLSAIRATNSKVTFDPIRRDVTNDKVVFPNIEIIIPGNKNVYNYNQNCLGNYSENFRDKCSTKVTIETLSVNNIGLKENRKQNVELEISGFSVDLKHLLSNGKYISAQMLDPINELIENGVLAGSVKVGVGYNLGLDQFSLELSIALNKLASFSIKTKLSNVKYHNNTYSFDLDELEVAVSEDGLRPFLDYQLQNTIGLELNSGMLLMLTAGIDEGKKGSLKDLKNIRSIASFIDGKSKKLFCKRGESIRLDFSNLDATGYLESPFSIVGVLCQEFTNSAY